MLGGHRRLRSFIIFMLMLLRIKIIKERIINLSLNALQKLFLRYQSHLIFEIVAIDSPAFQLVEWMVQNQVHRHLLIIRRLKVTTDRTIIVLKHPHVRILLNEAVPLMKMLHVILLVGRQLPQLRETVAAIVDLLREPQVHPHGVALSQFQIHELILLGGQAKHGGARRCFFQISHAVVHFFVQIQCSVVNFCLQFIDFDAVFIVWRILNFRTCRYDRVLYIRINSHIVEFHQFNQFLMRLRYDRGEFRWHLFVIFWVFKR